MSDSNNRNNGFDDYFDLLNKYAPKEEIIDENTSETEPINQETEEVADDIFDMDEYYSNVNKTVNNPPKKIISAPPMIENIEEKEKNPFKRLAKW